MKKTNTVKLPTILLQRNKNGQFSISEKTVELAVISPLRKTVNLAANSQVSSELSAGAANGQVSSEIAAAF